MTIFFAVDRTIGFFLVPFYRVSWVPQDPRCRKSLDLMKEGYDSKFRISSSTTNCMKDPSIFGGSSQCPQLSCCDCILFDRFILLVTSGSCHFIAEILTSDHFFSFCCWGVLHSCLILEFSKGIWDLHIPSSVFWVSPYRSFADFPRGLEE